MPSEFIYGASIQTEGALFFLSIFAGMVGTLVGLGGGILLIPTLVLIFHVPMNYAVATSIVCVIATSSAGASQYVQNGMAHVRLSIVLETATVLGALTAAFFAPFIPTVFLEILFTVILIYSALSVLFARVDLENKMATEATSWEKALQLDSSYWDVKTSQNVSYPVRGVLPAWLWMLGAGILSGLLGVGSGSLKVPVLDRILRLPLKVSTATSNLMMGVTAAASAGTYYMRGDVLPFLTAPAILGIFLGSRLGVYILNRIHNNTLRQILVLVLLLTALRMGMKALGF